MLHATIMDKLYPITEEETRLLQGGDLERNLYMMGKSDIVDRDKLLRRGKQIAVRPHTRFVHFPPHSHNYVEAIYMCSGQTTHLINGEKILLREGELLFLSRNAVQEILPAEQGDVAVNFIIKPEFFDNAVKMMGDEETPLRQFVLDGVRGKAGRIGYLHFAVADILPIQNLIENLIWTLVQEIPNKRRMNQITMGLLMIQLMNHTDRLVYQDQPEEEEMLYVLRYIEENYRDGSLGELAELLHQDIARSSREIKRKTGRNFTDLIQTRRLSQACFLLKNTDMKVIDIALQVGYDNISYFHRIFRQVYGMSPRTFRLL